MIIFTPFVLLVISSLSTLIFGRIKLNTGRIWLLSAFFSFINWGVILGFKWLIPINFSTTNWFPFAGFFNESINLRLDQYSWAFAFALASIQLAIILTDSTRLDDLPSINIWSGIFIINALGYIAILANSFLTIFLIWMLIDIVELLIVLLTVKIDEMINVGVISFAVKVSGIILLMLAIFLSISQSQSISLNSLSKNASMILLASIGLRLGVIPFNLPYLKEIPLRIGLGNTIRMVGVASGLIILIRFTQGAVLQETSPFLLFLLSLVAFIASLMWLVAKNELIGRPYWIIVLSSFSIYSAIKGDHVASIIWSIDLLLVGSVFFLFSEKDKKIIFLPLLATIGISGLPFTQSASGWMPLASTGTISMIVLNIFSSIFLLLGSVRHLSRFSDELKLKERWIWIVYPFGLFILLITHWLIFILSPFDWIQAGFYWVSLPVLLFTIIVFVIIRKIGRVAEYTDWLISILNRIGDFIISILSLNWLYKFLWYLLRILQSIVNLFSNLLESQTGIIWILILIAVFISVIFPGSN